MKRCLDVRWISVLIIAAVFSQSAFGGRSRLKKYFSSDKLLVASILTIESDTGVDAESKLEFRDGKGRLLGGKSFISKDHTHGLGVIKAQWTFDSNFFVFSTIASGGQQPGHFPTFFYSKLDNKIHVLDTFMGGWITSPEYQLEFPDGISVTVRGRLPNGKIADTLLRSVNLGQLEEK